MSQPQKFVWSLLAHIQTEIKTRIFFCLDSYQVHFLKVTSISQPKLETYYHRPSELDTHNTFIFFWFISYVCSNKGDNKDKYCGVFFLLNYRSQPTQRIQFKFPQQKFSSLFYLTSPLGPLLRSVSLQKGTYYNRCFSLMSSKGVIFPDLFR